MIIALTMWIIAVILGIADYKTESTRWGMALVFFAGLAGFSVFWGEHAGSIVKSLGYLGVTVKIHQVIGTIFSALSHYFIPYCALIFGLSYSKVLGAKNKKGVKLLLLLPLIITFLFFPAHDYNFNTSSQLVFYYRIFSIWAFPYLLISCILMINSCLKEEIPSIKKQRIICCLIAVPSMAFTAITTYLLAGLPADETWQYWRLNILIAPYVFIIFSYSLFKYGVLGIKLRIEKQNINNMMNLLNSGMKILSHSLKNEVTKISLCMTNIQLSLQHPGKDQINIDENIQMVSTSLEYLTNLMEKLQKNSIDPGKLNLTKNNLLELVETALQNVAILLKNKGIQVSKNVDCNVAIIGDKVYLQEIFVCIFQNAIEAMNFEGRLRIETGLTNKNLIVIIKDNGAGIDEKDLPHVIEPFFTTKGKKDNFGLGLSFCYNILNKHGATIEIQSKKNIGTAISLFFPNKKVKLS